MGHRGEEASISLRRWDGASRRGGIRIFEVLRWGIIQESLGNIGRAKFQPMTLQLCVSRLLRIRDKTRIK